MSSEEYLELKGQMDRIEQLLAQLAGAPVVEPQREPLPSPPAPVTPDMSEQDKAKARQAEGQYILATQGIEAYRAFWKEQFRLDKKPRLKRVA